MSSCSHSPVVSKRTKRIKIFLCMTPWVSLAEMNLFRSMIGSLLYSKWTIFIYINSILITKQKKIGKQTGQTNRCVIIQVISSHCCYLLLIGNASVAVEISLAKYQKSKWSQEFLVWVCRSWSLKGFIVESCLGIFLPANLKSLILSMARLEALESFQCWAEIISIFKEFRTWKLHLDIYDSELRSLLKSGLNHWTQLKSHPATVWDNFSTTTMEVRKMQQSWTFTRPMSTP